MSAAEEAPAFRPGRIPHIGELGTGTTIGGGPCEGACFNTAAANAVGSSNTFGYWFVLGPEPNYTTIAEAKSWGESQGNAAVKAWYDNIYVARQTIFADIEGTAGTNGWSSNTLLNQAVWEGWFSAVNNADNGVLKAGVYSAPDAWASIMGSSYNLNGTTPEWSYEPQIGCAASCPTPTSYEAQGFGGESPGIWQYAQNCGTYGDLDCSDNLPS